MSDAPPDPRAAASLLVVRPALAGPEVLMGLRGAGHKFMPNRLVFPGGAVDPEDHGAPVASPLRAHVLRRLQASADPSLAAALGVAAARELAEETGLSLGEPPHLAGLDYLCRAITPAASSKRFDARFFVVAADAVSGTLAGSGELEDVRWLSVADALALDLAHATRGVMARLHDWLAWTPAERAARTRTPAMVERVWRDE
jgi:8-oxo-dGTP pyrophosphatase MutT (NUDIX family)